MTKAQMRQMVEDLGVDIAIENYLNQIDYESNIHGKKEIWDLIYELSQDGDEEHAEENMRLLKNNPDVTWYYHNSADKLIPIRSFEDMENEFEDDSVLGKDVVDVCKCMIKGHGLKIKDVFDKEDITPEDIYALGFDIEDVLNKNDMEIIKTLVNTYDISLKEIINEIYDGDISTMGYGVGDLFDEDDILEYVKTHYDVEDVIHFDWD